jgi:hypothetical protein
MFNSSSSSSSSSSCSKFLDDETRFNACFCVNKLSIFDDNITILGDNGFIPLLIDVVNTGGRDAVGQACACLRHIAMRIENRYFFF